MKFAVLEFIPVVLDDTGELCLTCIDQGIHFDDAKEAEQFRAERIRNDVTVVPQNIQVICFTEVKGG